jgi:hypothetical protein
LWRAVLGSRFFFAFGDYIDHMGVCVPRILPLLVAVLVALPTAAEEPLWEWVTPWPQGHDLYAAAAGNGVTVAVGRGGTVITSTDGVEWRTSHTGAGYRLSDVVWGNGLFVVVGGESGEEFSPGLGVILTSDDGVNWVERHREDYLTLNAVVWTGAQFVAVGIGDRALLSSDGLNWSEIDLGGSQFIWDLAWNGSQLVALGRRGYFGGPPTFFTSENGEVWQQFTIEREYAPESIAASGGRFVAVGSEHDALVSDDGLTWTVSPYESPRELDNVVDGGVHFLAVGNDVVGTSLDGYTWSIEERATESRVHGLAWLGDGYLAVGEDGFMMSSPDGSVWTQFSEKAFDHTGTWEIDELAMGGSSIIGVGAGIVSGRHGTEWSWQPAPSDVSPVSVIWNGSAFWAAGSNGVIRSFDGIHWEQRLLDSNLRLVDIVWNGSLFVAVSGDRVVTSSDGHDWSIHYIGGNGNLHTVGWTGSEFVAAGGGSMYLISSGGVEWRPHPQAEDLYLADMAWNGDRLVAVGGRSEVGGVIRSTVDGLNWMESALPEDDVSSFDDVTWTGTHFVAVSRSSGDIVFTSTDGLSWTSETTGTGVGPVSVVGDYRSLYITGRGLSIIRRTTPLADTPLPRRPDRRVEAVGKKVRLAPAIR